MFKYGYLISQDFEKGLVARGIFVLPIGVIVLGCYYIFIARIHHQYLEWIVPFWWFALGCIYALWVGCYGILDMFYGSPKYNWQARHVFITGGSEGVGYEVAKILIAEKNVKHITLFSRSMDKLKKAQSSLQASKKECQVHIVSGDVSSFKEVDEAMLSAIKTAGQNIDVVLASAGRAIPKYFEDLTEQDYSNMMSVNYMGVVNAARAYLSRNTRGNERKFIAVCSIAAAVPFIGYAGYSPSKAAVRAFCDAIRNEFADLPKTQIHICFPPDMDTPGYLHHRVRHWKSRYNFPFAKC